MSSLSTQISEADRKILIKDSVRVGFFLVSGLGLLLGTTVGLVSGDNLLWQAAGISFGGVLGMFGGLFYGLRQYGLRYFGQR
ncbi:MAG: hypothetical protein COA78_01750 [Blastopirellula sp.]|nr:MAG: hypothetical protein COA78_01750 [Blastopirellula sp.]